MEKIKIWQRYDADPYANGAEPLDESEIEIDPKILLSGKSKDGKPISISVFYSKYHRPKEPFRLEDITLTNLKDIEVKYGIFKIKFTHDESYKIASRDLRWGSTIKADIMKNEKLFAKFEGSYDLPDPKTASLNKVLYDIVSRLEASITQ